MESDVLTPRVALSETHRRTETMFELRENPSPDAHDAPTRHERAMIIVKWFNDYQIEIGDYPSTQAITVTVSGATFVDKIEEYPSETLFANVALAIQCGAVAKLDRRTMFDELLRRFP
jgi:hypothetical protein